MNIVCLLNGSAAVRERDSEGTSVAGCGCAYTDSPSRWLQMCREHGEPCEALHVQAQSDRDREAAIRELTS
jgi:hypothetical protein